MMVWKLNFWEFLERKGELFDIISNSLFKVSYIYVKFL